MGGAADWGGAGRVLRERAEMALALGAGLESLADGVERSPEAMADRLQEMVGRVAARGGTTREAKVAPGRVAERLTQVPRGAGDGEPAVSLRSVQSADLSRCPWPVVWFASGEGGGERATLALGVRGDGCKQVVGLWPGGCGEQRLGYKAAEDLWVRGLNRGTPWLAVTGAERALGVALSQRWGARLHLVHDQCAVLGAVLAHLPASAREAAGRALRSAWDTPEAAVAHAALEELAGSWDGTYPGAAARLRQEIEPTTTVQALGVHGPLGQRLRTTTSARYLLAQGLPAGQGRTGRLWLGAVAGELLRRQAGFRRLPEQGALPALCQRLASTVPAAG